MPDEKSVEELKELEAARELIKSGEKAKKGKAHSFGRRRTAALPAGSRVLKEGFQWNPLLRFPANQKCFCGSGTKAKKCCLPKLTRAVPQKYVDNLMPQWSQILCGQVHVKLKFAENEKKKAADEAIKNALEQIEKSQQTPPTEGTATKEKDSAGSERNDSDGNSSDILGGINFARPGDDDSSREGEKLEGQSPVAESEKGKEESPREHVEASRGEDGNQGSES